MRNLLIAICLTSVGIGGALAIEEALSPAVERRGELPTAPIGYNYQIVEAIYHNNLLKLWVLPLEYSDVDTCNEYITWRKNNVPRIPEALVGMICVRTDVRDNG